MAVRDEVYVDIITETKKSIANLAKLTAAFFAVKKTLTSVIEITMYAAEFKQTEMAFKNIAKESGQMADDILASMKKASGGTISELNLMLAANKAVMLGIPMEELDKMMAIARSAATALGTDVTRMFNDIVTGTGRGSKLILDNLGIIVTVEEVYRTYASTLGKTAEELTEVERKQSFLNAILKDGERLMELVGEAGKGMTPMEPMQQFEASVEDLKAAFGEQLLPALNEIVTALTEIVTFLTAGMKAQEELKDTMAGVSDEAGKEAENLERVNKAIEILETRIEEVGTFRAWGTGLLKNLVALEKQREGYVKILEERDSYYDEAAIKERALATVVNTTTAGFNSLADAVKAANTELGKIPTITMPTGGVSALSPIGGPTGFKTNPEIVYNLDITVEGSVVSEQELEGLVVNTMDHLTRGY